MDIFAAAKEAQLNYSAAKRKDVFTGDLEDISATKTVGGLCSCRGACGSHTGPCTMKASKGGDIKAKMCKACALAASKDKKVKARKATKISK